MALSFSIYPVSQTINLEAGKTYEDTIKISNSDQSDIDLNYKLSVLPFGVIGEEYEVDLMTETERTQITNWIKFDKDNGALPPGETIEVPYKVVVPENVPAGGQYATIMVSAEKTTESDEASLTNNVYDLTDVLYANVEGETVRKGEILSNKLPKFVFRKEAAVSEASLRNGGNTHEFAKVSVKASKLNFEWGMGIYFDEERGELRESSEVVMPETDKLVSRRIEGLPTVGLAKVTQTVTYLGRLSEEEETLILCPLWLAVLGSLVILTALTCLIRAIVRKVKGKKKKQSKNKNKSKDDDKDKTSDAVVTDKE